MKKILLVLVVAFISCKKDNSPVPVDPRDIIIGTYTGFLIMYRPTYNNNFETKWVLTKNVSTVNIIDVKIPGVQFPQDSLYFVMNGNNFKINPPTNESSLMPVFFSTYGDTLIRSYGTYSGTGSYNNNTIQIDMLTNWIIYRNGLSDSSFLYNSKLAGSLIKN